RQLRELGRVAPDESHFEALSGECPCQRSADADTRADDQGGVIVEFAVIHDMTSCVFRPPGKQSNCSGACGSVRQGLRPAASLHAAEQPREADCSVRIIAAPLRTCLPSGHAPCAARPLAAPRSWRGEKWLPPAASATGRETVH